MPSPRPRDAATLVLVRTDREEPEVLMGRRAARDAWSDRYVFPGGRVDPVDSRVSPATRLRPAVERRLVVACSSARARALGVAAVRETFEETGLVLGKRRRTTAPAPGPALQRTWAGFLDRGLAPALDELELLCRAITPPQRPKRFNARFFVADAAAVEGELQGNGELHDLRWVSLSETVELPLPKITQAVLQELDRRLDTGFETPGRTPLFKMVHGRHLRLEE